LTEIIEYIDQQITGCVADVTSFGICHLVEDGESIYPSTLEEEAEKVSPSEEHTVTIYHRLLNGNPEPREDASFGRTITVQNNQRVRTVVFIEMSASLSLIDDIINALPDVFNISGYSFVNVSKEIDLVRDSRAVWSDEYGDAAKDKFQKRYNIYAIEYNVEYIKCPVCETES
jgi:hypothetical protein